MSPRGTVRKQTDLFQLETIGIQHDSPTSNHIQFCRNRFSAVCNLEPIPFVVPIGVLTDPRRDLIRIAEISALIKKIRGFIMRESTIYILAKDGRYLAIPSKPVFDHFMPFIATPKWTPSPNRKLSSVASFARSIGISCHGEFVVSVSPAPSPER
jgi:hypothetical protein